MAQVVVVTSGKGGVGKTTTAAAFATGLAQRGKKTVVIDFDVGLRNLDLIMGCERRVVFDFINVINGDAKLNQALIRDKRIDNLYVFPTSQTRDKDALKRDGVARVIDELKQGFDYIICDSPAGIEHGALTALYFADSAIIVTNPEVSSVRDSDRIIGLLASKSRRAERNEKPVAEHLLLTRYSAERVARGEMLTVEDVKEILSVPLLGIIPESETVLRASNTGTACSARPASYASSDRSGAAYSAPSSAGRDAHPRFSVRPPASGGSQRRHRQGASADRAVARTRQPRCAELPARPAARPPRRDRQIRRHQGGFPARQLRAPAGHIGTGTQRRLRSGDRTAPPRGRSTVRAAAAGDALRAAAVEIGRQETLGSPARPDRPSGFASLRLVAHPARFELTTSAFGGQRSIQLSYGCPGRGLEGGAARTGRS